MPSLPADLPDDLRAWVFDEATQVAVVAFSFSRCSVLSAAELDVARAAASGLSNSAIARRRGTSARTVANQIASVLQKLHAGSRAELSTIPELLG
ncbi:MAG TPA: helix-turn-helix transcriptional regulator [Polyangiaceae bacterium]|jgi:DNA-binding NarL/FixJ family response regulator